MFDEFSAQDIFVFDTETSGLGPNAEIVEISIVDFYGSEVFSNLIKPTRPIPPEATAIHGIDDKKVESARSLEYWMDFIGHQYMSGKILAGYNVMYDVRLLFQSLAALSPSLSNSRHFTPVSIIDVMHLGMRHTKVTKWPRLAEMCRLLEVDESLEKGEFHSSLYDAKMTAHCLRRILRL